MSKFNTGKDADVTNIGVKVRWLAGSAMRKFAGDAAGTIVAPPVGSTKAPDDGVYVKWPKLSGPTPAFLDDLEAAK
jgi:hypothetical protein